MVPVALVLAAAVQAFPAAPSSQEEPTRLAEVIVSGTAEPALLEPFSFFERLCFDANRLHGRSEIPDSDIRWVALEDRERDRLGIADGSVVTRMLETEAVTLVLKIERRAEEQLVRDTCNLTVVGEHDQEALARQMARTFGGPGTRRHLSYPQHYPTLAGWTQLAWAAIPGRNTADWRVFHPAGASEPGFVVVTEPFFYRRARYVVGELNYTAAGERPLSVISLTHLFKP